MAIPFQLQATEEVRLVLRRHWVHLYPRLALLVLAGVVPPLLLWFATSAIGDAEGMARTALIVVSGLWVAGWLIRTYFVWYRYQNDIWVLTDQRLVDSLKRHWFHHQMSSVDLVDIEDVSILREGLVRTLFNYGDLQVQTAAQRANFILSAIPRPSEILTVIDAARDGARHEPNPS